MSAQCQCSVEEAPSLVIDFLLFSCLSVVKSKTRLHFVVHNKKIEYIGKKDYVSFKQKKKNFKPIFFRLLFVIVH